MNLLEIMTATVCLVFLGYASWQDLKDFEVSNMVWLWLLVFGVGFAVGNVAFWNPQQVYLYIINGGLCIILSILFYIFETWGGADAKGFMVLSIVFPFSLLVLGVSMTMVLPAMYKRKKPVAFLPYVTLALLLVVLLMV